MNGLFLLQIFVDLSPGEIILHSHKPTDVLAALLPKKGYDDRGLFLKHLFSTHRFSVSLAFHPVSLI